jgi:hypothetical protein
LYEVLVLEKEKGATMPAVEETCYWVSPLDSKGYNLNPNVTPHENDFLAFLLPYPPHLPKDWQIAPFRCFTNSNIDQETIREPTGVVDFETRTAGS